MVTNWDERFRGLAQAVASWSKDPRTKVGCVVIGPDREIRSTGYNGFPRGVGDTEFFADRYERPAKYLFTEHAERNAIYNAVRCGVSLKGCTLIAVGLYPCADCARAIIQTGITRIVADQPDFTNPQWGTSWLAADIMLREAGVTQDLY